MINYILQVILFQMFFLAIYDLFLSKESFFTKNRWYLISTPILSFILPFIKIPTFQKAVPEEFIIYLPEIVLSPEKVIQETNLYQSINYAAILFWLGVGLFFMLFLIKLYKIATLIRKYEVVKKADHTLVIIPNHTKAFSFFNFIFLGKEIPISQQAQIIEHELVHSKQKHSLDLLFFEFLKIMMWFNPMIFMYQKRIALLHEYISDEVAAKSETKEIYINNLLSNFFQVENIAFVNQFYKQTFIKKRIIMMKKTQSKKMNQLKYLVLIPVLASMLFYTSCASKQIKQKVSTLEKSLSEEKIRNEIHIKEIVAVNKLLNDSISKLNKEIELIENMDKFKMKKLNELLANRVKERINSDGSVSIMSIDKAPTFPGCKTGDKDCFSKMVQKHFGENFNSDLPNTLGLDSGRKRVFVGFSIDKEGNVVDVKARAPHLKIKNEVIKVMNTLPKMIPGEDKGEKVKVKYSIPFTLMIK
ncbi:BlaR1 peptidase M56 [Polaribacter sp. SA4-10]|uniref:M56 family metallopeptidase n=1 Tax=Polaribacter sp. SA4-10 TaxID=754397 RepID=UPI000B3CCF90|nr:M56 family metallopeptidase [Polaribacter sp. SA4-10]ARV06462.1 BlaR1 peptidase M56 [Polaribacter sp. SA4-10]